MSDFNTNITFKRSSTRYAAAVLKKAKPADSCKEIRVIKHFERTKTISDAVGEREFPEVYCCHYHSHAEQDLPKKSQPTPHHSAPRKRSNSNASGSSKGSKQGLNRTSAKTKPTEPQNNNRGRKINKNNHKVNSTGRRTLSSSSSDAGKAATVPKPKKAKPSRASSSSIESNGTSSNDFAAVSNLNKTLRSVHNNIRINLNNIKDKDGLRLSIKDIHYQVKAKHHSKETTQKIPQEASVVTESYIKQLKNEINRTRPHQTNKQSPNVKELKSEISRYRQLIECGGNVLAAMDFSETNLTVPNLEGEVSSECPKHPCKTTQVEGAFVDVDVDFQPS